ncbi:MAG: HNH endonuclease [Planctomycetes bacterium]|nr:HNH endonuclease [Planctomycetota bacterium]
MQVEHVVPRSNGGSHTWDDVRVACLKCNLLNGDTVICLDGKSR